MKRLIIAVIAAMAVLNLSRPSPAAAPEGPFAAPQQPRSTFSVMTYNVKGLPFPLAYGRSNALAQIGDRLQDMCRMGRQPDVILLQEAFVPEAKAIARRAGYAHVLLGPGVRDASAAGNGSNVFLRGASWRKGEAMGTHVDSGLVILSDYPIVRSSRMVFPDTMCAGFDCLAAKGVVIAWVAVPGRSKPVAVADTHLNSRKASGVSVARANLAFARQTAATRAFLRDRVAPQTDLIMGGDFNIGGDIKRIAAAKDLIAGAREATVSVDCAPDQRADLAAIRKRNKDKLFHRGPMRLRKLEVPFGDGAGHDSMSDHLGYIAHYVL